jgi:hypothetical protein
VVTKCRHYFCEQCALQHNAKTKLCAACNVRFFASAPLFPCVCALSHSRLIDMHKSSNPRAGCSTPRRTSSARRRKDKVALWQSVQP